MTTKNQTIRDAIDRLEAAHDGLVMLRGLFTAIGKLGNEETVALAMVGKYIAEDWANMLDVDIEGFSSRLTQAALEEVRP
ncbi:MAG: hypothetical protein Q8R10_03785 [Pseudomonas sp.]|uniref:hypothetical protein n=1 Tax=Pseudomonas sp. TaxID=306 RepID=UPI002733293D|nr:hypothetical protein [Pseudomonas sp.]MDP3845528.1 hypothetical protein [Pseudomonas sp.]